MTTRIPIAGDTQQFTFSANGQPLPAGTVVTVTIAPAGAATFVQNADGSGALTCVQGGQNIGVTFHAPGYLDDNFVWVTGVPPQLNVIPGVITGP